VGTGAIAGPIVVAAVYLDSEKSIQGLDDSKRLSKQKRIRLNEEIEHNAKWSLIVERSVEEINNCGYGDTLLSAYLECISKIHEIFPSKHILVDGKGIYEQIREHYSKSKKIILGHDHIDQSVAAASIIAKVFRENRMREYSSKYSDYGFDKHNGYGTEEHKRRIKIHGLCPIHHKIHYHTSLMFFRNLNHLLDFLKISSDKIGIYSELERRLVYLEQIGILVNYQPTNDLWLIDKKQLAEIIKKNFQKNSKVISKGKEFEFHSIIDKLPKTFSRNKVLKKVLELSKREI